MIYGLHIGINNYRGTANDLSCCVRDARLMRDIFGGTLLLDAKATRKAILAALKKVVMAAGPGDYCVPTYSGHGSQVRDRSGDEPDGWDETLVAADLNDIVDDEFPSILARLHKGARGLFITDSCFSGTVHRAAPQLNSSHLPEIQRRRMRYMPSALVKPRRRVTNAGPQPALPQWVHLSGCTDFEFSYEGRKYGVLSEAASLEYYTRDYTIGDWYAAICGVVSRGEYGGLQHPQLNCSRAARKWAVPSL
jgi:hypothetical protein